MEEKPDAHMLSLGEAQPVKMTRKVSFRDEQTNQKIADVHLVASYKHLHSDEKGSSCLKCQLL
jgi:hypothetical protein